MAFFFAQTFALLHAAEHGSDPHEHGQKTCAIQALSKGFGAAHPATAPAIAEPLLLAPEPPNQGDDFRVGTNTRKPSIRGPPIFSTES